MLEVGRPPFCSLVKNKRPAWLPSLQRWSSESWLSFEISTVFVSQLLGSKEARHMIEALSGLRKMEQF